MYYSHVFQEIPLLIFVCQIVYKKAFFMSTILFKTSILLGFYVASLLSHHIGNGRLRQEIKCAHSTLMILHQCFHKLINQR